MLYIDFHETLVRSFIATGQNYPTLKGYRDRKLASVLDFKKLLYDYSQFCHLNNISHINNYLQTIRSALKHIQSFRENKTYFLYFNDTERKIGANEKLTELRKRENEFLTEFHIHLTYAECYHGFQDVELQQKFIETFKLDLKLYLPTMVTKFNDAAIRNNLIAC